MEKNFSKIFFLRRSVSYFRNLSAAHQVHYEQWGNLSGPIVFNKSNHLGKNGIKNDERESNSARWLSLASMRDHRLVTLFIY